MINGMITISRIGMSLGAVGLLLSSSTIGADVTFFDTQNNNSWQDSANWINSTAPTADVDGSIFVQSGFDTGGDPAIPITGLDTAYTNINGLEFLSTGVDSTYDLQGTGSLTFNPNASITNSKTSNADVSVDIAGASGTLEFNAANGSLGINGAVDLSAGIIPFISPNCLLRRSICVLHAFLRQRFANRDCYYSDAHRLMQIRWVIRGFQKALPKNT
ncbi:hypothetical protein JD969_03785 [Planctomycetota bacterium]|nr:hypothetical protein JD969_03785 [Planctomycetota bacterium]